MGAVIQVAALRAFELMLADLAGRYRDVPAHLRLERRVEVIGLGLGALALLLLGLVVVSSLGQSQVDRISPSADAIVVAPGYQEESVDAQGSLEIRARPLFWRSRRPEDPLAAELLAQAQQGAVELKPLRFKVAGVFGAGSDDAGFIAVTKDEVRRIRLGDSIDGWTVERIEPTTVELAGGGETRIVSMERRPVVAPDRVRGAGVASDTFQSNGTAIDAPQPSSATTDARPAEPPRLSLGGMPPSRVPPRSRDRNQSR